MPWKKGLSCQETFHAGSCRGKSGSPPRRRRIVAQRGNAPKCKALSIPERQRQPTQCTTATNRGKKKPWPAWKRVFLPVASSCQWESFAFAGENLLPTRTTRHGNCKKSSGKSRSRSQGRCARQEAHSQCRFHEGADAQPRTGRRGGLGTAAAHGDHQQAVGLHQGPQPAGYRQQAQHQCRRQAPGVVRQTPGVNV